MSRLPGKRSKLARVLSRLMGIATAGMAGCALLGWILGSRVMVGILPGSVPMHPITAILLPLGALALLLCGGKRSASKRISGVFCAGVITLGGVARLIGYYVGAGQSAETFLFPTAFKRISIEMAPIGLQVAPNTSLNFALLGAALLIIHSRQGRLRLLALIMCLASALVAILTISGNFINVASLGSVVSYVPMALGTATAFIFLAAGVISELADPTWYSDNYIAPPVHPNSLLRRSLESNVAVGFVAALMTLCAMGIVSYQCINQFIVDSRWDNHTYEVLAHINALSAALKDTSGAGRGYVITNDENFLVSWRTSIDRIEPTLNSVRALTADNPSQQRRIERLQPLIRRKTEYFKTVIGVRRDQGFEAAHHLLLMAQGAALSDEIRDVLAEMEAEENSLLAKRVPETESNAHRSMALVSGGVGFSLILVSLAAWMIYRAMADRAAAEEALIKAGGPLQVAIFNSATFSSIATDAKGVIQIFNVGAEHMLGYTAAEVVNRITPADISDPQEVIARANALSLELGARIAPGFEALAFKASRGIGDIYELTYVRKDGSRFPAVVSVTALRDAQENIIGYLLIGTDNAARKRIESRFRRLIDSNVQGVMFWNVCGQITNANDEFLRIMGYTRADLEAGRIDWSKTTPPEYAEIDRRALEEIASKTFCAPIEKEFIRKDGSRIPVLVGAAAFEDNHEEGVCFVLDRTESQRAEAAAVLLAAIVESSSDAVIGKDLNSVVTSWNAAAERIFGYSAHEMLGRPITLIFPEDHHDEEELILSKIKRGERVEHFETERLRKDGTVVAISVTVSPIKDSHGRVIGASKVARDITERKRAGEALRASEARLRMVTDNARVGLVMVDRQRRYTFANATYADILGLASPDIAGQRVADVLANLYEAQIRPHLDRAFAGERVAYELHGIRSDGVRHYAVRYEPSMVDGAVSLVVVVITEITERKQAEEALRTSEAQLQTIVENIGEAVVVSDLEGRLLHFNHAALHSLGYTSLKEGRRKMTELVDTFELSGVDGTPWTVDQWPLARILRGEKLRDLEARMRRIGTDWQRVFSFGGNLAHDAAGRELMAVVTFSDITERKQAETSLREGEERFRTMANSIPQLAWIARPDGSVVWYNERWYEYTGTTPEQMEGWGWQSVHDPQALPKVLERWKAALESGQPFEMEFPLRGADGWFRAFLTRVQPLKDSEGRVVQWFGTNTDVETLKQAEEKVRQLNTDLEQRVVERTAQLETANGELEAFSYSVSHDLRAPLRTLDKFSETLLEDYGDKLDAQGQDYLRRVRAGSQRMGHLIDDLLSLSRVARGEMSRELVDLSKMAHEVAEELRAAAPEREAEFVIAEGVLAETDPNLMRIVLTNLIGNAWKFTAKQPNARIEFGSSGENGGKEYFMRDNGAGFNQVYASKLFGAFQRLHSTKDFPGTGIGLATVQRIIHRQGGRIWADGKVGQGATFHFTL
jgi:PAS domain S-box-containing protein